MGFASGEKDVEDGIPHLRMNNIGVTGDLALDLLRTVPPDMAGVQHTLHSGDVLVCTTNSAKLVGKCASFRLEGSYAFSNHLTRLRPNISIIEGRFLCWSLWQQWQNGYYDDKCKHWVNQSSLPKEALLTAPLLLPPFQEQVRIVSKVEKLLEKVEVDQKRLAKIPVILKRFSQAVLSAACSGRLTADWREKRQEAPPDYVTDQRISKALAVRRDLDALPEIP